MGKIKRERPKYHIVADRKDDEIKTEKKANLTYKPHLNSMQNIFAGISIQLSDINKLDENPKSAVSKNTETHIENTFIDTNLETALKSTTPKDVLNESENKPLTKKQKLQLRHKKLMEKLDATQKAKNELQKRQQQSKRKGNFNDQVLSKTQAEIRPMLTPAATKSSNQDMNEQKNVFSIPSFHDGLPALNSVFESRKDVLCVQTKSSISKKKHGKKNFAKNYNYLKKSMANKMK